MNLERQQGRIPDEIVERRPSEADGHEGFIRKYGLLPFISALALNAAVTYKEQPAQAAEVQPGMTWPQGFSALQDDVFNSPVEQGAYAVVTKDGKVYWAGSKMGEIGEVRTSSSDVLRTVEDEIANKSLGVLCSVHTHPIRSAEHAQMIDKSEADAIVATGNTTLSIPPSGADVNPFQFGSLGIASKVKGAGGYVVNVVFDASRVWRHRIATDSDYQRLPDYWRKILGARELFPQWELHIKARLAAYSEEQLDALRNLLPQSGRDSFAFYERSRGNPRNTAEEILESKREAVYMVLLIGKATPELLGEIFRDDEVGRKLQDQLGAIGDRQKKNAETWNDVVYNQWVPASRQGEPSAELYEKLTEAYLRTGTVLESFPYAEVADDPLKLCRWPESRIKK